MGPVTCPLQRGDLLLVIGLVGALADWVAPGLAVRTHMNFGAGRTIRAEAVVLVVKNAILRVSFGGWWPGRIVSEGWWACWLGCGCMEQRCGLVWGRAGGELGQ